jgi:predicted PurR-regulated permease PerM
LQGQLKSRDSNLQKFGRDDQSVAMAIHQKEFIMSGSIQSPEDQAFIRNSLAAAIQIGLIFLLTLMCLKIIYPFINVVAWAMIIAVAIYPLHLKFAGVLGGRGKLSATLIVVIALSALLVPTWTLTESSVHSIQEISQDLEEGSIKIAPPADAVADWPVIGGQVHKVWSAAASNLEATLNQYQPQMRKFGSWLVKTIAGTLTGVLGFAVSIIIAGAFLVSAEPAYGTFLSIGKRLVGERGADLADISIATIRSVAKGVLGVALIQTLLAAIGLIVMDIPGAGIWASIVLLMAIMQLPPLFVLGPIAIWVFSTAEPVPATLFLIYALFVSFSDTFLKPLLLGRGVDVPMLVILLGAIGGMITSGIIGLFTGAIILALGYKIFMFWLNPDAVREASDEPEIN